MKKYIKALMMGLAVAATAGCGGGGDGGVGSNATEEPPATTVGGSYIASHTPVVDETGVLTSSAITVKFTEPMEAGTINKDTLLVQGRTGPTMNWNVDPTYQAVFYNSTTNTATYKVKQQNGQDGYLNEASIYKVTLTSGMKTKNGQPLSEYSWKFTTAMTFGVYSGSFGL